MNNLPEDKIEEEITSAAKKEAVTPAESTPVKEAQKKLFSTATTKELLQAMGRTAKEVANNPHRKELLKLQRNQAILLGLALADVVPGIEVTNDITKVLAIAQQAAKEGKKTGFFAGLYKDVPKGLGVLFEGLDIAGSPIPAAELWQMAVNDFKIWKERFSFGKSAVQTGWENIRPVFSSRPPEIQAARQQFKPAYASA